MAGYSLIVRFLPIVPIHLTPTARKSFKKANTWLWGETRLAGMEDTGAPYRNPS